MTRLILAGAVAGLLLAACAGMPAGPGPTPAVPANGDTARAALCDPNQQASFARVANELDQVDASTDTTQLRLALADLSTHLGQLNVSGDEAMFRDTAQAAVSEAQAAADDPALLAQVAGTASAALRNAEMTICQ